MKQIKTHRLGKLESIEYAAAKMIYEYMMNNPDVDNFSKVPEGSFKDLVKSIGYFKRGGQTLFEQVRVNYKDK